MIILLIVTHIVAAALGFTVCALLTAASRADDELENMKKEDKRIER